MKSNDFAILKKHLTEKILALRIAHAYTQTQVGEALSINQNAYSQIERGNTCINLYRLCQLSNLYNVPIGDLLGIESVTEPTFPANVSETSEQSQKTQLIDQVNQNAGVGSRGITARKYYEHHEHHTLATPFSKLPLERLNLNMELEYPDEIMKIFADTSHILTRLGCDEAPKTAWAFLSDLMRLNLLMQRINQVAIGFLEQRIENGPFEVKC